MIINDRQIELFKKNGVIILEGIFKPWLETLRKGFEKVLSSPGPHARENVEINGSGRFFEDYCNWQRIQEFEQFAKESPAAKLFAQLTKSKKIQLFHDHIFVKDAGTLKSTPWHQDLPYYCIDGNVTGSYWIPLDEVTKENSLKLILGSHKWPKLIRPTKWSNDKAWYKNNNNFMDMPDLNEFINNIFTPDLRLGDAILFNFKIVHGSSGNISHNRRRAFSMRFIGDDVRYIDRGGETSPPFKNINLQSGDPLRTDWFPIVWNN